MFNLMNFIVHIIKSYPYRLLILLIKSIKYDTSYGDFKCDLASYKSVASY